MDKLRYEDHLQRHHDLLAEREKDRLIHLARQHNIRRIQPVTHVRNAIQWMHSCLATKPVPAPKHHTIPRPMAE